MAFEAIIVQFSDVDTVDALFRANLVGARRENLGLTTCVSAQLLLLVYAAPLHLTPPLESNRPPALAAIAEVKQWKCVHAAHMSQPMIGLHRPQ